MSKTFIILTCPNCGSLDVSFDEKFMCQCNNCKYKYDISMNTNVNYIDSSYDVLLNDNIRLVKEFSSNNSQCKLLSIRCDDGKTYINAILKDDFYDFYSKPIFEKEKNKYKRLAFQSFMDDEFR